MAVIKITDYPVFVRIGCFESEKIAGQEVLVSLVIDVGPIGGAEQSSDDISATLDYGQVLPVVTHLVCNQAIKLIETVVTKIGRGLLQEFTLIQAVDATVEKRRIPGGLAKGASISVSEHFHRHELLP